MINWSLLALDIIKANSRLLRLPYRLFLVVTKSCQSRCVYCKIWQENPANEMTFDEYHKLSLSAYWLKWLNITGGEPTDRNDLPDIVSVFKKNCPRLLILNFTTNGLQPDRIGSQVEKISSLGLPKFHLNVSIDGPPEVHDSLRGVDGNFKTAIETLKNVRKIRKIESSAAMTIYPKNVSLIQQTFEAIKSCIPDFSPSEFHFNIPHISSHYYGNNKMTFLPHLTTINEIEKFLDANKFRKSPLYLVENIYRKLARTYINEGKSPLPCSAILTSLYISETGMVYPCTIWDNPLGSLRENNYNLSEILKLEKVTRAREDAESLRCPQCWTPCEAFPTILSNIPKVLLA